MSNWKILEHLPKEVNMSRIFATLSKNFYVLRCLVQIFYSECAYDVPPPWKVWKNIRGTSSTLIGYLKLTRKKISNISKKSSKRFSSCFNIFTAVDSAAVERFRSVVSKDPRGLLLICWFGLDIMLSHKSLFENIYTQSFHIRIYLPDSYPVDENPGSTSSSTRVVLRQHIVLAARNEHMDG